MPEPRSGMACNVSDFGFGPPTGPDDLGDFTSLASGDLNCDGLDDLVVGFSDNLDGFIGVLLARADGTWSELRVYEAPSDEYVPRADGIALGDFNGDGWLDVLGAGGASTARYAVAFFNQGDGTLGSRREVGRFGSAGLFAAVDMDRDGTLDIVTGSGGYVGIARGLGDGRFAALEDFSAGPGGGGGRGAAVADVNEDGLPDVVSVGVNGDGYVFLNRGHGRVEGRQVALDANGDLLESAIAAADFDGDGHVDIATVTGEATTGASFPDLSVRLSRGRGDGTFNDATKIVVAADGSGSHLIAGDLNGDGRTDLALSDRGQDAIYFLANTGAGAFEVRKLATLRGTNDLVAGHFTNGTTRGIATVQTLSSGDSETLFLLNESCR